MQIVSTPPLAAAKTPVTFDAAVGGTTGGTNQTLTLTLTVGGSNATVIANVLSAPTTITLGGVAGTLVGTYSGGRVYMWTGVSAGSKTFTMVSSGYFNAAVLASYTGAASSGSLSTASGTSASTITVADTNDRVISAFSNTSGNTIAASSGTARVGVSTGGPGYLSIIDGTGASSVTNAGTNASYSGSLKLAA